MTDNFQQDNLDSFLNKPVIGNSFRQFQTPLIIAITLGIISIGLIGLTVFFRFSSYYLWLAIVIGFCSICYMLILWKKLREFELKLIKKYKEVLDEHLS